MELTIRLFTPPGASLADSLPEDPHLEKLDPGVSEYSQVPLIASRHLLENAQDYDLVGYMEDDLVLSDPEFFGKILYLDQFNDGCYAFLPHRCEHIPGQGDDSFRRSRWGPTRSVLGYRGSPHSLAVRGTSLLQSYKPTFRLLLLTRRQALAVKDFWIQKNWCPEWKLSGPLEQACSGMLLPVLRLMKPVPEHYRFLMVHHQDSLWRRHRFEAPKASTNH